MVRHAIAVLGILMVATRQLEAGDASVQILEAIAGVNGDSRAQCITLRFDPGVAGWGPAAEGQPGRLLIVSYDAAGKERGRFHFPSDPPLGPPDGNGFPSALLATREFAALPGAPRPDFILPAALLAPVGGKLCLRGNPEAPGLTVNLCLSYGDFVGDTETDTAAPPNPAGPPATKLPITGARGLRRFQHFGAGYLGREQENGDFRLEPIQARNSSGELAAIRDAPLTVEGRTLFFFETFSGNGRTCSTCHKEEAAFSLPPSLIPPLDPNAPAPEPPHLWLTPDDPLLVAERVPELSALESPELMRGGQGLILENIDGYEKPPVFRASPPLLNLKHTAPYGLSGEFKSLKDFTANAVKQHFPRTLARNADPRAGPLDFRRPEPEELDALEGFLLSLTVEGSVDLLLASAAQRGEDPDLLRRGRENFFGEGKCFKCHSGPVLAEVHPSMVAEGLVPARGNRSFNTGVADPHADPGPTREVLREFSTRPLVGVSLGERFFHDNSAASLEGVLELYQGGDDTRFRSSPAGRLVGKLVVDTKGLLAFLRALVAPEPECVGGADCDRNGIGDVCELELDPTLDCNGNGVIDSCDVARGTSPDCNRNGRPDECESPGDLDVSRLAGWRGFFFDGFEGYTANAYLQMSAAAADVDGDGIDDLVVGTAGSRSEGGAVHVLFGARGIGRAGRVSLAGLDGAAGFTVRGTGPGTILGGSIAAADLNGDGAADLLLGLSYGPGPISRRPEKACVVFGGPERRRSAEVDLTALDGRDGFVVQAPGAWRTLVVAGDLNQDGIADAIVLSSFDSSGVVQVAYGSRLLGRSGTLEPAALDGARGFVIHMSSVQLGFQLASGGDFDGDGSDDIVLGVEVSYNRGYLIVVSGSLSVPPGGAVHLSPESDSVLLRLHGGFSTGAGASISAAGDVNGDGLDDIVVGEPGADIPGPLYEHSEGAAHVVFGTHAPIKKDLYLGLPAPDPRYFSVWGLEAGDLLGAGVASKGDANRDGFDDLVVVGEGGLAAAILGSADVGAGGAVPLKSLDGSNGVIFRATDASGKSALRGLASAALGDFNGDGFADAALLRSLPGGKAWGSVGEGRVIFGPFHGPDCNRNGIPDSCEIQSGADADADVDGVPDACEPVATFHRGDPDASGGVEILDAIHIFNFLFLGGPRTRCAESADVNNDGRLDIADGISLLGFLFAGTEPPASPGPPPGACGPDSDLPGSAGDLGCLEYRPCARAN